MKISTKLMISTLLILGFTLTSCFFLFSTSKTFNELSAANLKYDKNILAITDFRAASRQIVVEAYQSLYLSDGKKRVNFALAVEEAEDKLNKLKGSGVLVDGQSELLGMHFKELINRLTHSLDLQSINKQKEARQVMEGTIEIFFKKEYIGKISSILFSANLKNNEIQTSFDDTARKLSYLVPLESALMFLIVIIFFVPLTFSLRRKVGLILRSLNELDFKNNYFPTVLVDGQDEFSTIATHFNELTIKLRESKLHIEKQQQDLVNTSRLASLGEISAGIAHEINNPLAIIEGSIHLLTKFSNEPEKFASKIESINKSCLRISTIVNGLKKFSRSGDKVNFKSHSLSEIVKESMLLTEVKSKRHDTTITYECDINTHILCNEIEIEQVLINLINNSIDAVKNNADKWIKVSIFEEDKFLVLRVMDAGPGIPYAIQEKLFNPFFTTKIVGEGTGLGLSISKGILDEHLATITVVPNIQNTCFEIRFQKVEILHAA